MISPQPVADLAQGKVWFAEDVDDWIKTHRQHQAAVDEP
jgi:hypothetical protein